MHTFRLTPLALALLTPLAQAQLLTGTGTAHTTYYDTAIYGAATNNGYITFHDWGYVGPNGAGANDFYVPGSGGFNASRLGQVQDVITLDPDGLTPDASKTVRKDDESGRYTNANMDGQVNFYRWAYTTIGGSTFDNMKIDQAGNYFVAREDMKFQFYDYFHYSDDTGANPDEVYDTVINFQPYAISDAVGWCGSTMVTNPNGLEVMAGQVSFDFAFDAYLAHRHPVEGEGGGTQIVPDFIMRSYGDYVVDMGYDDSPASNLLRYSGGAVTNNTNPETGELDPDFQNRVSFLGAGVVPKGVWVTADSYDEDGNRVINPDSTWQVTVAGDGMDSLCDPTAESVREDGAVCWQNSFAGYAFLMRADGQRTLTWLNPDGHSDYVLTDPAAYDSLAEVPLPAAGWLLLSGLAGLVATARRRRT